MPILQPALILIPGLLCNAKLWEPLLEIARPSSAVVILNINDYSTIEDMAKAILKQVEGAFYLGALSMGGYVAFEILRQAPDRVKKLALFNTTALPDTPEQTKFRLEMIDLAQKIEFSTFFSRLLPRFLSKTSLQDQNLVKTVKKMAMEAGKDVYIRHQKAIIGRVDSRPLLPHITCPALVIAGEEDVLTPAPAMQEMAQIIPNSEFFQVAQAGHLTPLESPKTLAKYWKNWINS